MMHVQKNVKLGIDIFNARKFTPLAMASSVFDRERHYL